MNKVILTTTSILGQFSSFFVLKKKIIRSVTVRLNKILNKQKGGISLSDDSCFKNVQTQEITSNITKGELVENGEVFVHKLQTNQTVAIDKSNYFGLINRSRHNANYKVSYNVSKSNIRLIYTDNNTVILNVEEAQLITLKIGIQGTKENERGKYSKIEAFGYYENVPANLTISSSCFYAFNYVYNFNDDNASSKNIFDFELVYFLKGSSIT